MPFVQVKCPSCQGDIELDDEKEYGICKYCGSQVRYEEQAVQNFIFQGAYSVDGLIQKGFTSIEIKRYDEAYQLFDKALEFSPNDERIFFWLALTSKDLDRQKYYYGKLTAVHPEFSSMEREVIGASVNKEYYLHRFASIGDAGRCISIIQAGANANVLGHDGLTPLAVAVQDGNFEMALALIENGARVEHPEMKVSPLYYAVQNKDMKLARLLLENGAAPNACWPVADGPPCTPIEYAITTGDQEMCSLFIRHGADVNLRNAHTGLTPLMKAVLFHPHMVTYLLSNGASANVPYCNKTDEWYKNDKGVVVQNDAGGFEDTPLQYAVRQNDKELVLLFTNHDKGTRHTKFVGPTDKSRASAALLAFFLGSFGIHKFYLGKPVAGVIYLLFCWTGVPMVLGLIESVIYLCMSDQKFYDRIVVKLK